MWANPLRAHLAPVSVQSNLAEPYEALRLITERLRRLAVERGPLPTPEQTELRHRRARLLGALGHPELAVRDYTRCLLADPHNSAYYVERAALHRRLGNVSAALADDKAAKRAAGATPVAPS